MDTISGHPHGRHFQHCYAGEGGFCFWGGQYRGDGPRLETLPAPFNLLAPNRVLRGVP
ncbi:hypothetical protein [Streptomyces sp. NRRL F-4428]|uniref:hypothetical protein n=1 Tax=Streptomyces sp. NRRL F-4428 TaxID=1609137 RepID=UPI000AAEFF63|nr:hypothetical protein [Streptomyces sp. NRRL F-4428]